MPRAALLVAALCVLAASCRKPAAPTVVRFEYKVKVAGEPDEASSPGQPVEITLGAHEVLPALEAELVGLRAGETKSFSVPPERGYGVSDPAKIKALPAATFASRGVSVAPGMIVQGFQHGKKASARVVSVGGDTVTLDFNHPLAGKTLDFSVTVLETR